MYDEYVAFNSFSELLKERLDNGIYTTEDSIRYLFFSQYLKEMCKDQNDFILELPFSNQMLGVDSTCLKNAADDELDASFNTGLNSKIAIEFKYHRKTTASDYPHTNSAGELFNDIARLSLITGCDKKYLVYVTDPEMDKYLDNNKRPAILKKFYTMQTSEKISYQDVLDNCIQKTFQDASKKSIIDSVRINCEIFLVYRNDVKDHHIRIYQVL